jgi:hypothetical protein
MLPHRIPRILSSKYPALAQILNQLAENQEALQMQPGRLQATSSAIGFSLDARAGDVQAVKNAQRFVIVDVQLEWLVCVKFGDTAPINVAKPPELRASNNQGSGDSRPITSDADDGTVVTVTESIHPPYRPGDEIWAVEPEDGTGVIDGTAAAVTWLDLNVDARHWDCGYQLLQACVKVNGINVLYWVLVKGGTPVRAVEND